MRKINQTLFFERTGFMKYIVILGDGMADYPVPQLNNKTPLQYAKSLTWIIWHHVACSDW